MRTTRPPKRELSMRETQIHERILRGLTSDEIAKDLGISPKTIETHRTHINRKLGVSSSIDLIRVHVQTRLMELVDGGTDTYTMDKLKALILELG